MNYKKIALPIIQGAVLTVVLTIASILLLSHYGYINLVKPYIIYSGSMEPAIKTGSVVFSIPEKTYFPGDIITYAQNNDKKNPVTHRIDLKLYPEGVNGKPVYLVSGDANKDFDKPQVKDEQIIGRVFFHIPYLGYVADFAKKPQGFILFVIIPTTIIIYEELRYLGLELSKLFSKIKSKLKKKEKPDSYLAPKRAGLPKITVLIPVLGAILVFLAFSAAYFSDIEKSIGSIFQAASSFPETLILENKRVFSNWEAILGDGIGGTLKYIPEGPVFDYEFEGKGLIANKPYCLIYYADPWVSYGSGKHGLTGSLIGSGSSDGSGNLEIESEIDLGTDLPNSDDGNYPTGAKIWLIPCASYDIPNHRIQNWNPNNTDWLFEMRLIKYNRIEPTPTPTPSPTPTPTPSPTLTTIYLNHLGGDIGAQYGYSHDYTNASSNNVYFSYLSPALSKLSGTIHGTGLKPYTTYQVKFGGIPTCLDSINGNDSANEYIGYEGRWTCVSSNCSSQSALERNRSDAQYVANKAKPDSDPAKECLAGYLVWDHITADSAGAANKAVSTSNSFHVLGCEGVVCGGIGGTYLTSPDSSHSTVKFCPVDKVDGQIERGSCGGLTLNPGNYHLQMSLTEESFHLGSWATVLYGNIDFEIQ